MIAAYTYGYLVGAPIAVVEVQAHYSVEPGNFIGENSLAELLSVNPTYFADTILFNPTRLNFNIHDSHLVDTGTGQQWVDTGFNDAVISMTLREFAEGLEATDGNVANSPANIFALNPDLPTDTTFLTFVSVRYYQAWTAPPPYTPSGGSSLTVPPVLRLNQRDDGLGATSGHARMISGNQGSAGTSGQMATAPRLNQGNIYDPGKRHNGGG